MTNDSFASAANADEGVVEVVYERLADAMEDYA